MVTVHYNCLQKADAGDNPDNKNQPTKLDPSALDIVHYCLGHIGLITGN